MTDRPLVLLAYRPFAAMLAPFADRYEWLGLWEEGAEARFCEAHAIVMAGEFALDPALLARMPRLGLIACFSVGYDGVDVAWARAHGVAVTHAHDANHEDVADHAIGLIITQRRLIVEGQRRLLAGEWNSESRLFTRSLGGLRLGLVGLGSIGLAVARRAEAMRMRIGWWGPRAKPDAPWPRAESLEALARDSDILCVAARAHDGNRGLVSADVVAALGPDGVLVNVARGQLVDEDALIAALKDGRLGGAALDVYATEPTPAERWRDVPNCVLTPHSAGATDAAVGAMTEQLIANLDAFHAGRPLPTPIEELG